MKRLSRNGVRAVIAGALAVGAVVGVSAPANAGNLSAYNGANYVGLLASSTLANLDVTDDLTSSIKNQSSYNYNAQYTVDLVGYTMFTMPPGQLTALLGRSQNNSIDHFTR